MFQMKYKISSSNFLYQKQYQVELELFILPPDQTSFLEILSNSLTSLNMFNKEWHILGDLNINLYQNGSILGEENKNIIKDANKISPETQKISRIL